MAGLPGKLRAAASSFKLLELSGRLAAASRGSCRRGRQSDSLQPRLHPGWLQVGYVKGIDLSPGEIVEARKRFQEQAAKRRGQYKVPDQDCSCWY